MTTPDQKLAPHPKLPRLKGPVVLLILDGVGEGRRDAFDAVFCARTPTLDRLRDTGLVRTLRAHGAAVGLASDADAGNSEVGHNIMGAGRIFDQGSKVVESAVASGRIWNGKWKEVVANVRGHDSALHIIGLLSDGNVHSHERHLRALIDRAREEGLTRVYLHALFDGRDVPDRTAETYVEKMERHLAGIRSSGGMEYFIASGGGRMVTTMDRYDANWPVVAAGWRAHVLGSARQFKSAGEALAALRAETPGISDQDLPAFTIGDGGGAPIAPIRDGDSVVLANFRGDRAIEISRAFIEGPSFTAFDRERTPAVYFAGMTLYDGDTGLPPNHLVTPESVRDTVSELLAATGVRQFACAETQKFGHVTYFWNGNRSEKFSEETEVYCEIPSDRVPFAERPWMKSAETADRVIEAMDGRFDFIRANFAGGDMVGHTGQLVPAILAIESIDLALARIVAALERLPEACLVVTADHGNAEEMAERKGDGTPVMEDGRVKGRTSHTANRVPFIVWERSSRRLGLRGDLPEAGLANIAATVIELLGFVPPPTYEPTLVDAG